MLKSDFFPEKSDINVKNLQKHVVQYKKKVARVLKYVHLCIDNLNNLFALETNTY